LTRSQVETLRKSCAGEPCLNENVQVGTDACFSRRFDMRENDVWLVELRRQK
jgi:hypothetical protein